MHSLVPLYLLSMLLMEDLAENLLISLAARVSGASESNVEEESAGGDQGWMRSMCDWSENDIKHMKVNVITLMEAAGESLTAADISAKSFPELLQSFEVGTQQRKEWRQRSKQPPKPSELGPISEMLMMSTGKRAKHAMRQYKKDKNENSITPVLLEAAPKENSLEDFHPSKCSYPDCPGGSTK